MVRVGLAVMAMVLVGASVALAAPPPGSSLEDRRIYYAEQAIDNASKRVERDHACRRRPAEQGPVDGVPSAALLNSLAPLRRPAQPGEDVSLFSRFTPIPYVPSIYRDFVRVIPSPDGTDIQIFAMHDVSLATPRPKHCVVELRERVKRAIADRPRAFKRIARRLLRGTIATDWAPRQREGLFVFSGGFGVQVSLATFRRYGIGRLGGAGGGSVATFYALMPDGVATIDFTFRRFEPTGYWSKHHPVTYRSTGTVAGNVLTYTGPTTLRDGIVSDQIWRASDGHVIRVIRAF
jgi:hypothetical protein